MSPPPESVTERTFYPAIIELVKQIGNRIGIEVAGASEVGIRPGFPDLMFRFDGHSLLVQVKIDSYEKMLDDLAKTYPIATSRGAGLLLLLLSSEARRIYPLEVERVAPKLRVKRALLLASWASKHSEEIELQDALELVLRTLKEYEKYKVPLVDYLTVAGFAREAIEELAGTMRHYVTTTPELLNQAQAIIGSFDFYRSLLSEFVESEEIMKTYIADIVSYITILALLFLHAASVKRYKQSVLPQINNPLSPPEDLLDVIDMRVRASPLYSEYQFIADPFLHILAILKSIVRPVSYTLARYLYAVQTLRPEHVKEEVLGRIYQEGLPPETRKNLGAFFTNPVAARLLAYLAIDNWDEKVLDPACGSGTLLVSTYEAKMEKALQQGLKRPEVHKLFLNNHIIGIDIMQFAKELTSINLALQDIEMPIKPKVYWGDGIEKMISVIPSTDDDPPQQPSLYEYYIQKDMDEYRKHQLVKEGFDLVIMNPPFTRRERIPKRERNKLDERLGEIVKGKVGYWAYFFAAADNVIKLGGKLASVTPEEFFTGSSAESIRRYLLGEVVQNGIKINVTTNRIYIPEYIVKLTSDIAFSEEALYKDYLVMFRKTHVDKDIPFIIIVLLKKKLDELKNREQDVIEAIKSFALSNEKSLKGDLFDAIKLMNPVEVIKRRVRNLKPLVAFNTIEAFEFFEKISKQLSELPTLGDLEREGLLWLRNYNPGQYTARGEHVESYATSLFVRRYGSRGKVLFDFKGIKDNKIILKAIRSDTILKIDPKDVVPALRSVAGVRFLDLTGREEYALVRSDSIDMEVFKRSGLVESRKLDKATKDIRDAYERYAGEILLARRFQITSPDIFFIAFYSSNKLLAPATVNILRSKDLDKDLLKALTLFLNSTLALFQLLSLQVETRGSWVRFDADVWRDIYVPNIHSLALNDDFMSRILETFNFVTKSSEKLLSLYQRISSKSQLQKRIDKIALEMLGLNWSDEQLSKLYDVIKSELDVLQHILEESQKRGKKTKRKQSDEGEGEEKPESVQKSLTEWMRK
jgi:type I restriction-modification system DNA methylase subunit